MICAVSSSSSFSFSSSFLSSSSSSSFSPCCCCCYCSGVCWLMIMATLSHIQTSSIIVLALIHETYISQNWCVRSLHVLSLCVFLSTMYLFYSSPPHPLYDIFILSLLTVLHMYTCRNPMWLRTWCHLATYDMSTATTSSTTTTSLSNRDDSTHTSSLILWGRIERWRRNKRGERKGVAGGGGGEGGN